MTMTERTCPRCGLVFSSDKLDGLCPACLLSSLLDDDAPADSRAFWEDDDAGTTKTETPARRFSHFEILDELGRGGMGIVYRARDVSTSRIVALKVLQAHHLEVPDLVQRFRSEVRAVTSLDHPNVLPVHEVGEYEGIPFFSMKLTTGGSLAQRIGEYLGKPRDAARLLAKVARGVQHAHERGILHRDLKPANILIDAAGEPYVCDFGLAKWIEDDRKLTLTAAVLGTPHYIAPEQASGEKGLTTAADIYSLGAILYELITARPPFIGTSIIETLRLASENTPERPSSLVNNVPRDLETICLKCLEREPGARYPSASALAIDLENWLAGIPINARPVSSGEQLWRWAKRNPLPASLMASLVLLLAVIAAVATVSNVRVRESLHRSLVAQGKAARSSGGRAGQRVEALEALQQAGKIQLTLQVRDEAAAALALADLTVEKTWTLGSSRLPPRGFDLTLEHVADEIEAGVVRVLRLDDQTEIARLSEPGAPKIEYITHSGRNLLAVRHSGGLIKIWDIPTKTKLYEIAGRPTGAKAYWYALDCCFSPDGRFLALGHPAGGATLHEATTGKEVLRVDTPLVPSCLAFSPDGKTLAMGSTGAVRALLWDLVSNREIQTIDVPGPAYQVAWSQDARQLAVASSDVNIYVYEVATARRLGVCKGHRQEVIQVMFNREGDRLISTSRDRSIRLWSLNALVSSADSTSSGTFTQEVILTSYGGEPGMRLSPDGSHLGVLSGNTAHLLAIGGTNQICRTMVNGKKPGRATLVGGVSFSPDGKLIATASYESVDLWDVDNGRLLGSFDLDPDSEKSVRFGRDSTTLLVSSRKSGLLEYELVTVNGEAKLEPRRTIDASTDFIFSNSPPGDKTLIGLTSHKLGIARVIDLQTREEILRIDNVPFVWDLALSPDRQWAVIGFSSLAEIDRGNFQIWSLKEKRLVRTLPLGIGRIARFTPDGKWLIAPGRGEHDVWRVGDWSPNTSLKLGGSNHAFAPDGSWIAGTVSDQGNDRIRVADSISGEVIFSLESPLLTGTGFRLAASPEGRQLAALSSDNTLLLWNLEALSAELASRNLDWKPKHRSATRRHP